MFRTRILLAALLLASFSAHADWSYFGQLPAGGEAYLDLASRSTTDKQSRIRLLANYSAPHAERDGTSILSSTSIQEFECTAHRTRLLDRRVHDGSFGQGASRVTSVQGDTWKDVPAGSRGASLMTVACVAMPLIDAPTRDWSAQPLVPGSTTLRYDPSHTKRDGQRLIIRWLMEQAPGGLQPPASHKAASTEAQMSIDCGTRTILATLGIGRAEAAGRGAPVTISAVTQAQALDQGLPGPLMALASERCAAR
jgi:hypothetical protein